MSSALDRKRTRVALGPYRVCGPVIAGGSCDVVPIEYHGARAAAKWLLPGRDRDDRLRVSFEHEAALLSRCRAPGLPTLLAVELIEGRPTMILQWIDGQPLSAALGVPWPVDRAVSVMSRALDALDALHELSDERGPLSVIHRDLCPANLIICDDTITIVDLGLASSRLLHRAPEALSEGTLGYHAPELFTGEAPIDRRVDVFCAAIILWELLAGRALFPRERFAEASAIVGDGAPDVRAARGDVPAWLAAVIARGLSRSATDRYRTASEFARALRAR